MTMKNHPETPAPAVVWLTSDEVAKRLGTSRKQVTNMRARGEIFAGVKVVGLGLRWSERALNEWMLGIEESNGRSPPPHTVAAAAPTSKHPAARLRKRPQPRIKAKDCEPKDAA